MATVITSECINCGACEPECPNTAIYQGGVQWEHNGQMHPPISNDIFYIVPEKCTECVGFYDHEACAAVCPVDCCVPDPNIPETEEVLIARARQLHPEQEFPADFPSRVKAGGNGHAEAAAPPAGASQPAAPPPAAAAPQPVAAKAVPAATSATASARTERPLVPPKPAPAVKRPPRKEKTFAGELSMSFEDAVALLQTSSTGQRKGVKWLVALAQPLLGALPYKQKKSIEEGIGDRRFFSAAGATSANALHNFILYPIIAVVVGVVFLNRSVFSEQFKWLIFLGVTVAMIETLLRMREGFQGRAADQIEYRAALYGLPLAPLAAPLVKVLRPALPYGTVGQDGFTDPRFDGKLERERRYGEVYRLREEPNGFLLEVEFPRLVPRSAIKEQLGVADEMPDYDYDVQLHDGYVMVKGNVIDREVRKVAAVSPAFPPDFATQIKLPSPVAGFRHRFRGKDLEVALLKRV